ncbi:MAG: hypothetical protein R2719_05230 [Micropruina sp.]
MDRQRTMLDSVRDQPPNQSAANAPLLTTEDVTQGVRIEVHDDATKLWRSLHQVRVRAEVVGGRTLEFDDVAFLQETAATHSGVDKAPVHVHEAVFGWDGWSLSAARPALPVVHEGGEEKVVTDPQPPDDPSTPVLIERRAAPGTLPRLRFGRRYSFRAWAVDLAGNSRPHRVGAVPPEGRPPQGEAEARVTANLSGLRDFTATSVQRLREGIARTAPAREPAIEPGRGEGGVRFAEVLPQIVGRLQVVRGEQAARPVASALAEVRSALASGLQADDVTPAATAVLNPAVVASGVDLNPDLAALFTAERQAVTPEIAYVRWQPVPPPAIVPRRAYSEGESNEVLVIRSGVEQDPVTLEVSHTDPEAYAAAHPGRFATCERHLVPPKTSQFEAELHHAFDAAIGSSDAAAVNLWLHAAIRESGTLFDLDLPRLDDPSIRDPQDGVELVHGPGRPRAS